MPRRLRGEHSYKACSEKEFKPLAKEVEKKRRVRDNMGFQWDRENNNGQKSSSEKCFQLASYLASA